MAKISQQAAHDISVKVCEPINKQMVALENQMREKVSEWWKAHIPPQVMKLWKTHSEWVESSGTIMAKGPGMKDHNFSVAEKDSQLPNCSTGYYINLELTTQQVTELSKLVDKKAKLKAKYDQTKKEVESTILSLGTHKRVAEQFPEIVGFFDDMPSNNTALMIQIDPVREKVRCLISPDEEKKCIEKL